MYLVLMQQKFNPRSEQGGPSIISYYGKPLYLADNMSHMVYDGIKYKMNFVVTIESSGIRPDVAREGMRGRINVYFRKHYYKLGPNKWLTIVETKDVNPYLHNHFEFNYVIFDDMRFEMIFENNIL